MMLMEPMLVRFLAAFTLVSVAVLPGCSTGSSDYLDATSIEPIQVPEGKSQARLGELYAVPQLVAQPAKKAFKVPLPPVIGVQDGANLTSLQTMREQFWVVNAKSAASTWSQLMAFLQQRGIAVAKRDLAAATIETDWFTQALQPGFKVRYRLRLEHGLQPNTTEVYFLNTKREVDTVAADSAAKTAAWTGSPEDAAHAKWLANELLKALSDPEMNFGDSYLATTLNLPEKITLSDFNAEPVLLSRASDQRLQKALAQSLNENGFSTYDKALDRGIFHFDRYQVKQKGAKLLGMISIGGNKGFTKKSRYPLADILAHLPNRPDVNGLFPDVDQRLGKKKLSNVPGYLLVVQQRQGRTLVWVRDGYGRLLKAAKARDILDTLRLRLL